MVALRRSTLWKAISLSHTEEEREVLCGMVVAVNLFELDGKIGANPYITVGVDTHAEKVIREQFYYV